MRVDAIRGGLLPARLGEPARVVVGEGVTRVDLDEVVHQQHGDDVRDVDRRVGMGREDDRHEREVPRVLRGVLAPEIAADRVDAQHGLQGVDFEDEVDAVVEIAQPSWTSHSKGVPSSACCISEVTRLS